jgi:MYXO-CTERM domain-containing protein
VYGNGVCTTSQHGDAAPVITFCDYDNVCQRTGNDAGSIDSKYGAEAWLEQQKQCGAVPNPASAPAEDDGGCALQAPSQGAAWPGLLLLALAGASARRARRRSTPARMMFALGSRRRSGRTC